LPAFGNVARDLPHPNNAPNNPDQRDGKGDFDSVAALGKAQRPEVLEFLPSRDTPQDLALLSLKFLGNYQGDRCANDLASAVAKQALGPAAPAQNHPSRSLEMMASEEATIAANLA
jgi:hypothetical protein